MSPSAQAPSLGPQLRCKSLLHSCRCNLPLPGAASSDGTKTIQRHRLLLVQSWGRACSHASLQPHSLLFSLQQLQRNLSTSGRHSLCWSPLCKLCSHYKHSTCWKASSLTPILLQCEFLFMKHLGANSFYAACFSIHELLWAQHLGASCSSSCKLHFMLHVLPATSSLPNSASSCIPLLCCPTSFPPRVKLYGKCWVCRSHIVY